MIQNFQQFNFPRQQSNQFRQMPYSQVQQAQGQRRIRQFLINFIEELVQQNPSVQRQLEVLLSELQQDQYEQRVQQQYQYQGVQQTWRQQWLKIQQQIEEVQAVVEKYL